MKIFTVILFSLVIALPAEAVTLRGVPSCGLWVKARNSPEAHLTNLYWLLGFLSGKATELDSLDFLKGVDNPSIELWMDGYCRKNPLSHLAQGGEALIADIMLRRQK